MPEPHSHGADGMPVYPDATDVAAGRAAVPDAAPIPELPTVTLADVGKILTVGEDGSLTFADASGGSVPVRFIEAQIKTWQSSFSKPTLYFPVVGVPAIGPVFGSLPVVCGADTQVASVRFKAPSDGGADITLNYVELTVTNQDGTEVLTVYTEADIVLAAGQTHTVTLAEFSGSNTPVGTDLTLVDDGGGSGSIHTDAGGVFTTQVSFDITPPA